MSFRAGLMFKVNLKAQEWPIPAARKWSKGGETGEIRGTTTNLTSVPGR